jgi:hypothetical protein
MWFRKKRAPEIGLMCEVCNEPAVFVYLGHGTHVARCAAHGRGVSLSDPVRGETETRGGAA